MKSRRFVGLVLSVCLPGLLAFAPVWQDRVPKPRGSTPQPSRNLSIKHLEASRYLPSTNTQMVRDVKSTVDPVLATPAAGLATVERLSFALARRFGDRATQSTTAIPEYVWWWNGEEWVIVCLSVSTFEVDFGTRGTVAIELRESMDLH